MNLCCNYDNVYDFFFYAMNFLNFSTQTHKNIFNFHKPICDLVKEKFQTVKNKLEITQKHRNEIGKKICFCKFRCTKYNLFMLFS